MEYCKSIADRGLVVLASLVSATLLPAIASAQIASGEQAFRQKCQMCHVSVAGQPTGIGPNLAGVVGRKAGATGYGYSPALKASKLVWTRANLDRFLSGPARMVPGTRMSVVISDPAQRSALINYLPRVR